VAGFGSISLNREALGAALQPALRAGCGALRGSDESVRGEKLRFRSERRGATQEKQHETLAIKLPSSSRHWLQAVPETGSLYRSSILRLPDAGRRKEFEGL